jgi:regulatory protein
MIAGKITSLEIQKKNKERVNVFIDGEFAFGLNLMDAAHLKKGQVLSEQDIARLKQDDDIVKAVDSALRFLEYRPRSTAEVRQNLNKKQLPPQIIEDAMARLQNLGYLDDEQFARFWVENRDTFKPRGPLALRMELRQKGVADPIIDRVVSTIDTQDAAYRAAQKKLRRYRGETVFDFKRKLGGFLGRRGFDFDVINDVLHRIIQELQDTDPAYFAGEDRP